MPDGEKNGSKSDKNSFGFFHLRNRTIFNSTPYSECAQGVPRGNFRIFCKMHKFFCFAAMPSFFPGYDWMCACAEHPSACSQVSKPEVLHVSDSFQEICRMTEKETRRERELLAGDWGTGGHFRRLIPSVFRGKCAGNRPRLWVS